MWKRGFVHVISIVHGQKKMNRQLTGRIAGFHFSPTVLSRQNLIDEGIADNRITVTGNTVIDALYVVVEKIKREVEVR